MFFFFFALLGLNHPSICCSHISSSLSYTMKINNQFISLLSLSFLKFFNAVFFKAPSQPPANIAWKLTNSKICLNWEHVKTMENESEVLGYKVSDFFISLFRNLVTVQVQRFGRRWMFIIWNTEFSEFIWIVGWCLYKYSFFIPTEGFSVPSNSCPLKSYLPKVSCFHTSRVGVSQIYKK